MPFGGVGAEKGEWKRTEDMVQEVVMTSLLSDLRVHIPNFIQTEKCVFG